MLLAGVLAVAVLAIVGLSAARRLRVISTTAGRRPEWLPLLASFRALVGYWRLMIATRRVSMPRPTTSMPSRTGTIGLSGVPLIAAGWALIASATLPWAARYTRPRAALWATAPLVPPSPVLGSCTGGTGVADGGGLAFPPLPLTAGAVVAVAVGFLAGFGVLVGTAGTGVSVGGAAVAVAVGAAVLVATTDATVPVAVRAAVVAVALGSSGVLVAVGARVLVRVGTAVFTTTTGTTGEGTGVLVGVMVKVGVAVGVLVAVLVGVLVGVAVLVGVVVGVVVGVLVGVVVGVAVGVLVGVAVGVLVGVLVGVFVAVGVLVAITRLATAVATGVVATEKNAVLVKTVPPGTFLSETPPLTEPPAAIGLKAQPKIGEELTGVPSVQPTKATRLASEPRLSLTVTAPLVAVPVFVTIQAKTTEPPTAGTT